MSPLSLSYIGTVYDRRGPPIFVFILRDEETSSDPRLLIFASLDTDTEKDTLPSALFRSGWTRLSPTVCSAALLLRPGTMVHFTFVNKVTGVGGDGGEEGGRMQRLPHIGEEGGGRGGEEGGGEAHTQPFWIH